MLNLFPPPPSALHLHGIPELLLLTSYHAYLPPDPFLAKSCARTSTILGLITILTVVDPDYNQQRQRPRLFFPRSNSASISRFHPACPFARPSVCPFVARDNLECHVINSPLQHHACTHARRPCCDVVYHTYIE